MSFTLFPRWHIHTHTHTHAHAHTCSAVLHGSLCILGRAVQDEAEEERADGGRAARRLVLGKSRTPWTQLLLGRCCSPALPAERPAGRSCNSLLSPTTLTSHQRQEPGRRHHALLTHACDSDAWLTCTSFRQEHPLPPPPAIVTRDLMSLSPRRDERRDVTCHTRTSFDDCVSTHDDEMCDTDLQSPNMIQSSYACATVSTHESLSFICIIHLS